MHREETLQRYLAAIQARDLAGILALFAPAATVSHPVMGELAASEFFPRLLEATSSDRATQAVILHGAGRTSALWFQDAWTTPDGSGFENPIVLLFDFGEGGAVEGLTVIFDTHPMRKRLGLD